MDFTKFYSYSRFTYFYRIQFPILYYLGTEERIKKIITKIYYHSEFQNSITKNTLHKMKLGIVVSGNTNKYTSGHKSQITLSK